MNFQKLNHLYREVQFDEIKVIGKEGKIDGNPYHIMGMILKERKAYLYVMEFTKSFEERETWREKTPRESLKESMESDRNSSIFMHIREFRNGNTVYETAGAVSGAIEQGGFGEAYLLFMKMYEAGWGIDGESAFIDMPWERIAITQIEFRGEYEKLPPWEENMEVLIQCIPTNVAVEKSVVLQCKTTGEIEFLLKDGSKTVCYINKVELMDIWAQQEKKFSDITYKEKMLQHMSEDEFEQMKKHFFEVLEEHCPRGKCYMTVEYECGKDISLNFYDKEYLDTIPKPNKGSASAILMSMKPEKEIGEHGYKLRGSVIQKPLDKEVRLLEAELFSYVDTVQKRYVKL